MAVASTNKAGAWIIRAVIALMLFLLAFFIMRIVITVANPESIWKSPKLAGDVMQASSARGTQNFSFKTDPFNRAAAIAVAVVPDEGQDAPETTLQLTLTGRTTGPNGSAILRTPDNKEATYSLEDEIITDVFLKAVNKNFIVLDVDGQIQRLTFDRGEQTGLMDSTVDSDAAQPSVTVKQAGVSAAQNDVANTPAISGDITSLFQNISLRRVMKDGQMKGYSVKANRPSVNLSSYGFAKGDIVTAIGSTDITRGRPDFLALFETAAQSGGIEVTVLRNGQTRTLKLGTP